MIEKILNEAYLNRLDNIKQWQERDVFKEESVSQHSFKVAVFARVLLEDIFGSNPKDIYVDFKLQCVTHAMFHDWDESLILRDLSHDTKYNTFNGEEVRKVLDDLSQHIAKQEFNGDDAASKMIYQGIYPDKNKCIYSVHTFVKLCDWLAALFYIKRELSLGNESFNEAYEKCVQSIHFMCEVVKEDLCENLDPNAIWNFKCFDVLQQIPKKWQRQ